MCVPGAQGGQKNMLEFPGTGGYELPCRCWDLNPCPPKKAAS